MASPREPVIQVLPRRQGLPLPHLLQGPGEAYAVVWPGAGARHRSLHHVVLQAGSRTLPVRHPASEAVYYAVAGAGRVNGQPVRQGQMWFFRPGQAYRIEAGPEGLTFVGGPCPPDPALYGEAPPPAPAESACDCAPLVLDVEGQGRPLPLISRHARLVVGPWNGARVATMNFVILEPGEGNAPHAHPLSEDSLYVIAGRGRVTGGQTGEALPVAADACVHIPAGLRHWIEAAPDVRMVSVGGPCPPDRSMLGEEGGTAS